MKKFGLYFVFIFISITGFAQNKKADNQKSHENYMGKIWEVKPGNDLEDILPLLQPGDQLVLHEGEYDGSLILSNTGLPDYPIIIHGYGNGEKRPVLSFRGKTESFLNSPLLKITGSNVVLDYLKFQSKNTYCIRIGKADGGTDNIIIKNSVFHECGGGSISANYLNARYDNIHILDNYFIGPKRTPVYIGNHEGKSPVTHFSFKGNVIDGSQNDGPKNTIGYGIELKLNVTKSIVENNFITGTKGPGIMVYGAENTDKKNSNIVRNNIIVNARKEAGIVIGGGPSVIQNNVIIKCKFGMYFQNYDNRNLLDNIVIDGNTLLNNRNYGMSLGNVRAIVALDNKVISQENSSAFIDDPNRGANNSSINSSMSLDKRVNDVVNKIPERNNLNKIWRHVSSGPQSKTQLKQLISLILEHMQPTEVIH